MLYGFTGAAVKRKGKMMSKLVKELRQTLNLSEDICIDAEILKASEGKYFRAIIEARLALENPKYSASREVIAVYKKLTGK